MIDAVISNDGVFDSGANLVTISGTWQTVARVQNRGRRITASVIIGPQTIGGFQILQAAYPDDPNPVVIASGTGLNSPALSNESYIAPAVSFPLAANSVFQVHLQGDASEYIFQANTGGSGSPLAAVQVKGSVVGARSSK